MLHYQILDHEAIKNISTLKCQQVDKDAKSSQHGSVITALGILNWFYDKVINIQQYFIPKLNVIRGPNWPKQQQEIKSKFQPNEDKGSNLLVKLPRMKGHQHNLTTPSCNLNN